MNQILQCLSRLSSAEEFLDFLGVDYDSAVVRVNRLHIMKRFGEYLASRPDVAELGSEPGRDICRLLLARAYGDFVGSCAVEQKVFKVFKHGATQRISVDALRGSRGESSHA
jgi:nitrogenase-stabilizing/protective protein